MVNFYDIGKARDDSTEYFIPGIAKRLDRINSPLPRLIDYRCPLSGSGYATSMSVLTAFSSIK
ncbi:MAG: hypothetical protein HDS59_06955 [Barnesiella sp.]|nr:hypothetical protein [Barnesiella sp.]